MRFAQGGNTLKEGSRDIYREMPGKREKTDE
jgi:hypothetical protein